QLRNAGLPLDALDDRAVQVVMPHETKELMLQVVVWLRCIGGSAAVPGCGGPFHGSIGLARQELGKGTGPAHHRVAALLSMLVRCRRPLRTRGSTRLYPAAARRRFANSYLPRRG